MLNDAFAGTIAFKHDSKFTGCPVSSGDTTLESVALVCGIGLYHSLEVASTSGCWCVSSTCPGSVLLVLLVLLLFLPLVVLVSYYYLLRFDVLGCGLLAPRCLLWSLYVPWSLCVLASLGCLLDLVCSLCLTCSSLSSLSLLCLLSWLCLFSAHSGFLALFVLVLVVSFSRCGFALGFWLLISIFARLFQSCFLARLSCLAFLHARRPWSISATFSVSLAPLAFLLIVLFWCILATFSAHLGHEYLVSISPLTILSSRSRAATHILQVIGS